MLILTRKPNEEIYIGEDVRIVVTDIDDSGEEAVIGIDAPEDVKILRDELMEEDEKKRKKKQSQSDQRKDSYDTG